MKYRRLGGTDLDVSVICLGPMRAAAIDKDLPDPAIVGRAYDLWKSGFGLDG